MKEEFMQLAIEIAKKGKGRVHPNPLVGCVIVKGTQILGQGFHEKYGGAHAEVNALADAWKRYGKDITNNAEMFVTLEPCCHFGKTPPCVDAIVKSGVKKVFVAMRDANPIVAGKGIKELEEKGIKVEVGLCGEEAEELNESYIKWMRTKRPFVLLKIAVTEDGFISWGNGKRKKISGRKSLERVQELRNEFDAVLVGINTVLKDNPRLDCRKRGGRNPARVVLDPELKIPLKSNFLKKEIQFLRFDKTFVKSFAERVVFCGNMREKQKEKIKGLKKLGVKVIFVKEKKGLLNLKEILKMLGEMLIVSVLVEGGQRINTSFLKEKLVDRMVFFVADNEIKRKAERRKIREKGLFFVDETIRKIRLRKISTYYCGKDLVIDGYL